MNKITTNPEQAPLFDMADAGMPLLMEREGRRYYVIAEDRLDAFVAFIAPKLRLLPVPMAPGMIVEPRRIG